MLPTLWVPYSGGSAPRPLPYFLKRPLEVLGEGPGPRGEEGKDGAISSPFCPSPVAVTALPGVTRLRAFSPESTGPIVNIFASLSPAWWLQA